MVRVQSARAHIYIIALIAVAVSALIIAHVGSDKERCNVWMTYKVKQGLPELQQFCYESWIDMNPEYNVHMYDDADIDKQIRNKDLPRALPAVFESMPLPVMKADIWRYCVVYLNGGIYSDSDNACVVPIEKWNNREQQNKYDVIITLEPWKTGLFQQWCLVSNVKKHPLFKIAIDLILERASEGIDTSNNSPDRYGFVHYHTGPTLFSDAVKLYVNPDDYHLDADEFVQRNVDRFKEKRIRIMNRNSFLSGYTMHFMNGFNDWKDTLKKEYADND